MISPLLISGLLPLCVFVMMICIGLELVPAQFRALLRSPKPLLVGMLGQLLVAPAAGFGVAAMFAGDPLITLAIVLVVAAPGGPVANGFVLFGRGRPDVSVALTAVNGLLALASTPLIVHFGFAWFADASVSISLPVDRTVQRILLVVVLPILLGMALRHLAGSWRAQLQGWTRRLAMVMLIAVLGVVFIAATDVLSQHWTSMVSAAVMLCVAMFAATAALASITRLDAGLRMTIATEVSVHNVPLAILMAESLLERPELGAFIVIYAPTVSVLAFAWACWHRLRHQHQFHCTGKTGPG